MTTIATDAIAAQCRGTPGVQVQDNRGLAVRALQYNRNVADEAATQLMTRQRYTATGQLLSSLDPRLGEAQQLDPTLAPNFRYLASLSGKVLHSQSQDAGTTVQLSDIEGGPIWQRASRGQCTHWRYDALHRPTLMFEQAAANEPERISERYTYADGPAIAAAANCRGRLLTQHDTAGLNEVRRYSLGGQVQVSVRRLLRAEVPASDWQGEETAWETALEEQAYTSRQGFDAQGRIAWSLDAKGNHQAPTYNVAGQLLSSQLTLAGQSSPQALLQNVRYSAAGQVQREVAGNSVVSDYRYEPQTQRLSQLTVSRPAQSGRATLLQDLNYDYDPVGNILAISDAAQPTRYHNNQRIAPTNQYQYDALYQLLSASGRENADAGQQGLGLPIPEVPISADPNRYSNYTRSYRYDRGGNLTQIRHQGSKNYTQELVVAPTSNRAVQQTGFLTPADVDGHFDAAGNLQQLAPGQPLTWDGRNQLQEVVQVQRDAGPDDREWYRYDGGGQRVQKTSVSQTSATQRQAEVIYLPGLELRRTRSLQGDTETTVEDLQVIRGQAAGQAQVRVLHWEIGQPETIPNDQVRYSLDNQIGSSLLELDQQADILTLEEYFPFGGTAVWSGKTQSETQYKFVRYSGKERDATGLYYYGFRYYAPWLGRWLNPDPAGTVDGLNLFRMVRNNPVTLADIEGLAPGDRQPIYPPFSALAFDIGGMEIFAPKTPWDAKGYRRIAPGDTRENAAIAIWGDRIYESTVDRHMGIRPSNEEGFPDFVGVLKGSTISNSTGHYATPGGLGDRIPKGYVYTEYYSREERLRLTMLSGPDDYISKVKRIKSSDDPSRAAIDFTKEHGIYDQALDEARRYVNPHTTNLFRRAGIDIEESFGSQRGRAEYTYTSLKGWHGSTSSLIIPLKERFEAFDSVYKEDPSRENLPYSQVSDLVGQTLAKIQKAGQIARREAAWERQNADSDWRPSPPPPRNRGRLSSLFSCIGRR